MFKYNFCYQPKFLLLFLCLVSCLNYAQAQVTLIESSDNSVERFIEWNIGLAAIDDNFYFPGTSVLFGETYMLKNKWLLEYEIGLALPSVATAKIGIGAKLSSTKVLVGVRPYPFTLFYQMAFESSKKGDLILSFEYNPLTKREALSFYSRGNINIGYRWILNSKRE